MSLEELERLGGFENVMERLPPELQADKIELTTIRSFVRKLPRDGVLRRAAERILHGSAGEESLVPLLRNAILEKSGFRWRERIVAAWCLGLTQVSIEKSEGIRDALDRLINNRLQKDNWGAFLRLQWRTLLVSIPFTLMFKGGLTEVIRDFSPWNIVQTLLSNVGFSIFVLPFSAMLEKRRLNLARAAAVLSLGRIAAPEAAGVVAAAVYDKVGEGNGEVKKAAERALPAVLRALRPDDYGRVGGNSVDHLCRVLQDRRNHLVISVLEALEKVGGGSAVESVSRLAKKARARDVKQLAQRVLPVLEARRRDEQAPTVLLRATTSPGAEGEVLLRPVESRFDSDPDLLVRPVSVDSEDGFSAQVQS